VLALMAILFCGSQSERRSCSHKLQATIDWLIVRSRLARILQRDQIPSDD
jgi:hypothetical protein